MAGAVGCDRCGARLKFALMRSGKRMPVNPTPDKTGNVAVLVLGGELRDGYVVTAAAPLIPGYTLYRPHWADCSSAPKREKPPTLFD